MSFMVHKKVNKLLNDYLVMTVCCGREFIRAFLTLARINSRPQCEFKQQKLLWI